jgi:4-hydroxy 2-oxovalerate aldolase
MQNISDFFSNFRIQMLDCTLRDGGLGLEDAHKNDLSDQQFSANDIENIENSLFKSNIDIIELGSIELSSDDKKKYGIYQSVEDISKRVPLKRAQNQLYVGLYRGPDTPIEDISNWKVGMCDGVRVILRYSELQKSLDFCAALSKKGYKVFVQPMLTMRYTDDELGHIIKASNDMNAYALYFVDSYGYMEPKDVQRFFDFYDSRLNRDIRIGFHAHNNMNLAFANARYFLNIKTDRKVIVDSCMLGMGQGAGNLQTEIITDYLNDKYKLEQKFNYNYEAILGTCELVDNFLVRNSWGYSLTYLLPAIHHVAYKYSVALRYHYKLKYVEMNNIFKHMPEDLRERYSPENVQELLKRFGYENLVK